jgi:hypothetical protein
MRSPAISKEKFAAYAERKGWSPTATNKANPYECGRWIALIGNQSCCVVAFDSEKNSGTVRVWVDGIPTADALKAREQIVSEVH